MLRRSLIAAAMILVLAASSARATQISNGNYPIELDFTETSDFDYFFTHGNGNIAPSTSSSYDPTSDNVFMWLNRFETQLSTGPWHADLRFDSALFLNAPAISDVSTAEGDRLAKLLENRYVDNFILEQISASYASSHFDATLGDFHVSYGRGFVLSLIKIDALGVDTTLRGASLTGRAAGFSANVVGGVTNVVNTDPSLGAVAPDPSDPIVGGRVEYRVPRLFVVGIDGASIWENPTTFAYAQYDPRTTPASQLAHQPISLLGLGQVTVQAPASGLPPASANNSQNFSATAELPNLFDHGSAYVELAHQFLTSSGIQNQGNGFYAGLNGYLGDFTLQVEFKDYLFFNFPTFSSLSSTTFPSFQQQDVYSNPPNLEEIWQEEDLTNHIYGPRARLDWQVTEHVKPFATVSYFVDDQNGYDIYNGSAGVEANWHAKHQHLIMTAGYRREVYNAQSFDPGLLHATELWLQFDLIQALSPTIAVELDGLLRQHHDYNVGQYLDWNQSYAYLSLRHTHWSASIGYESYTQFVTIDQPNNFNVSGSYTVSQNLLFRAFVGSREAGLRCINGVCRNFPGFNGATLEVVARY